MNDLQEFVESMSVAPEVYELRPDCAVLVLAVDGVMNGPTDDTSRGWLHEASRRAETGDHEPHLEAWRSAYRSFGVKPQKFRSSFDALLRRASSGLPQINRVVDAYNAVSVKYGLPVGGENIDAYKGALRLVRSNGTEIFDTVSDGRRTIEIPEVGEVVWVDEIGVTCRRWNWRQGLRTRVQEETSRVFFVLERLSPFPIEQLYAASEELLARVASPTSTVVTRLLDH